MKRPVMVVLSILSGLFVLGGCAAVHENQANNQLMKAPIDSRYVSAVETMGRRVGNRVYWVNPPKTEGRNDN